MAKKPSFFEKLTGANWSEDDSEEQKKVKSVGTKSLSKKDKLELSMNKKTKNFIKKEKSSIDQKPVKEDLVPETKESEDWLAESEGQLTIDVYQTPNEIVIKSTIAGVKPEDIDITMANDMITIKGNREKDEEVKEEDYYYQECYWGPFSRSVILPVDVEVDKADASMKNGILTIRLPKVEKIKTKKILIKTE
ncbi:MAG: Hsp20/alpha crystallin family protein [Parcubacteria group bacterium]|nr:Hsp20/alpha crystallin family protein [Parcubacteria group bacterium]